MRVKQASKLDLTLPAAYVISRWCGVSLLHEAPSGNQLASQVACDKAVISVLDVW